MPKNDTSVTPAQGAGHALYARLSKAELIEIISADIRASLSRRDLYRCAMSAVCLWCDDVVAGNYASLIKLNDRLQAISDIYQHKR